MNLHLCMLKDLWSDAEPLPLQGSSFAPLAGRDEMDEMLDFLFNITTSPEPPPPPSTSVYVYATPNSQTPTNYYHQNQPFANPLHSRFTDSREMEVQSPEPVSFPLPQAPPTQRASRTPDQLVAAALQQWVPFLQQPMKPQMGDPSALQLGSGLRFKERKNRKRTRTTKSN
ncbi:hypothetical protein QOT17_004253 [Balamuthia mandrillaris]